ncbi:WecB/TagA/CpsF family glycosyltransferase [Methylicorpusculum sp.]|uniref:WecB/TagA/CpsF family glycosyltransferase n=1 Tax=Methylicorpusculum sp. TaxID=2713644 RepID=UPI003520956C
MASHLARIHVPVQVGVGAAFDFHSGHVHPTPVWMQKMGLEWVYRMIQDYHDDQSGFFGVVLKRFHQRKA